MTTPRREPTPRRGARLRRFSTGHLLALAAGFLGVALTLSLLGSAGNGVEVAVVSHDLEPGQRLRATDLELRNVRADADLLDGLVPKDQSAHLVGLIATRRVDAGTLADARDFRSASQMGTSRTMSVPVERARAVAGDIAPGDVVDLVASSDVGAWYVATGVEVISVDGGADSAALPGGDDHVTVTVTVDERSALELARAISALDVTIVRATGADPVADVTPLGPIASDLGVVDESVPATMQEDTGA